MGKYFFMKIQLHRSLEIITVYLDNEIQKIIMTGYREMLKMFKNTAFWSSSMFFKSCSINLYELQQATLIRISEISNDRLPRKVVNNGLTNGLANYNHGLIKSVL